MPPSLPISENYASLAEALSISSPLRKMIVTNHPLLPGALVSLLEARLQASESEARELSQLALAIL